MGIESKEKREYYRFLVADMKYDRSLSHASLFVIFRGSGPDGAPVPGSAGSEDSLSGV